MRQIGRPRAGPGERLGLLFEQMVDLRRERTNLIGECGGLKSGATTSGTCWATGVRKYIGDRRKHLGGR
jgi:hypothetical protein